MKKYWALDNDEFCECYNSPEKAIEHYKKNAIYRDEEEVCNVFFIKKGGEVRKVKV